MLLCHNIELYFYAATLWKTLFLFPPAHFLSITCFYLAFVSVRFYRNWSWSGVRNKPSGDKLSCPYYRFYSKPMCRTILRAHKHITASMSKRVKMHGWCSFCAALCLGLLWSCFVTTVPGKTRLSRWKRRERRAALWNALVCSSPIALCPSGAHACVYGHRFRFSQHHHHHHRHHFYSLISVSWDTLDMEY